MVTKKIAGVNSVLASANVGFWEFDIKNQRFNIDETLLKIIGYTEDEIDTDMAFFRKLIDEQAVKEVDEKMQKCITGTLNGYKNVFNLTVKNGNTLLMMEDVTVSQKDEKGNTSVISAMVYPINIDENSPIKISVQDWQNKVDEKRHEKFEGIFEIGSWEWFPKEDRFIISPGLAEAMGRESIFAEMNAAQIASHLPDGDIKKMFLAKLHEYIAKASDLLFTGKIRLRNKNGEEAWFLNVGDTLEFDENGKPKHVRGDVLSVKGDTILEEDFLRLIETFEHKRYLLEKKVNAAENVFSKNQQLVQVVNEAAMDLLMADTYDFDDAMMRALDSIGKTANVERVFVWENVYYGGTYFFNQIYKWSELEEWQVNGNYRITEDYLNYEAWHNEIINKSLINTPIKYLPEKERKSMEKRKTKSILLLPLSHGTHTWGYIGFEDCKNERKFSKADEKVLGSAATIMVSAIVRNKATLSQMAIQDEFLYQDRLLKAVNDAASILLSTNEEDFIEKLYKTIKILGSCLNVDRAYLWHTFEADNDIYSEELCEWTSKSTNSVKTGTFEGRLKVDNIFPAWRETLAVGKVINAGVEEMPENLKNIEMMHGVKSFVFMPLFVDGEYWGMMGFDSCKNKRIFTNSEIDILKSSSMMIGNSLERNHITENLIKAREQALLSMNAKTEFLSRMSHEIRTPMNAIIGMTAIAKKANNPKKMEDCLDKIDNSSRQLLGLINDILDMSKIDANKLEITNNEFDFEKMMESIFNVVQVRLEEKQQDLHYDFEEPFKKYVVSDELRINQVLTNLLTNAVKFTPEGGKIKLKVRHWETGACTSMLHVEVRDNGIGISQNRQKTLFQMFEQGDGSITRQFGGTGLGLAICKKIVNLMGGEIWVESEEGKGSLFIFEIPFSWGSEREDLRPSDEILSDLKILVIDDMADVTEYFANIFSGFGINCDTALSGKAGIELTKIAKEKNEAYDIIFIDWNMPVLNGGETAKRIREIMDDNIIVVMISVADWSDIEDEARSFGIRNFLSKPILPSSLYNLLLELTCRHKVKEIEKDAVIDFNWENKNILLVEDVEINREIMLSILEETGVAIECAVDGREACEKFEQNNEKYDIILMDVQMPVMDGLTATRKIRDMNLASAKQIPIIAMTANAFKEDETECINAGMNAHLAKPIEVDKLFSTLNGYIL